MLKKLKDTLVPYIELRGTLSNKAALGVGLFGFLVLMVMWQITSSRGWVPTSLLPSPLSVLGAFKTLHFEDYLVQNAFFSIKLNFLGYLEAVLFSLLLGFPMGLFPVIRALFSKYVDAFRYLPLPALTGIFISLFGIGSNMKVQFLTVGIIVYLLPTVIVRIDEVEKKYIQAVTTLGASKLQLIRKVFIPHVLAKISDDIRVLVAISWTYIVIVELLNDRGGLGSMIHLGTRQGKPEKFYAVLLVIVLIGVAQDKIFKRLDKFIFPHKHVQRGR